MNHSPIARTGPTSGELRALARLTLFATLLGAVVLALLAAGHSLPAPPMRSPERWSAWLGRVGPAPALMGGVRLVGIVLAGYLLALVAIELVGRATGVPHLLRLGRMVSAPWARRLVHTVAGAALAASITAGAMVPASPAGAVTTSTSTSAEPEGAVMRALDDPEPTTAPSTATPSSVTGRSSSAGDRADTTEELPTMRALDDPASPASGASPDAPPPTDSASTTTTTAATASTVAVPDAASTPDHESTTDPITEPGGDPITTAPAVDRWVIERGDHLWGVARRTLAGSWHRPPTDGEVARYLHELIDANLDVLVVPGDADLVFVGQEFTLPPVPVS